MTEERHFLVTSIKDEGPYLLEFIAHHRVLGFARHLIASNDCSDGSDLLLDALDAQDIVTHMRNPLEPGQAPQPTAYRRFRDKGYLDGADWIMVLDADEFLQVLVGDGRVGDLTALAGPETDLVTMHSLSFGTSDDEHWQPGLVTRQFTRRLPSNSYANAPIKSISRAGRFGRLQNHTPAIFQGGKRPVRAMLGSGERIQIERPGLLDRQMRQRRPDERSHLVAYYNHYPIKSLQSYCLRQMRGTGAAPAGEDSARYDLPYWDRFARGRIEDDGIIARYGAELDAELQRLMALPGVAEAHARAEALHRKLLDAML